MQFHIDQDSGSLIAGWVNPDNPSTVPTILISVPERPAVTLRANVLRPDVKTLGNHNTGMVGFAVDSSVIHGLEGLEDIRLVDADTGVLLHRRSKGLNQRVFCFDLCTVPDLPRSLDHVFTFSYSHVEQYPFDTLSTLLNNPAASSMFASGEPLLSRYEEILRRNNFFITALLRQPQEELAQRLLLARAASTNADEFHDSLRSRLGPLLSLAANTALDDPVALENAFDSLTPEQLAAVANPFVRTIACGVDELPERRHVAVALNNLAGMDLVGVSARFDQFGQILSEMLGADIFQHRLQRESPEHTRLVEVLSSLPVTGRLLSLDLLLYSFVDEAIEQAASQAA